MTSKAKALLRALVTRHIQRLRAGERAVDLPPADIAAEHELGLAPERVREVADELVTEGLCVWTEEGLLRLLPKALEKTL